MGKVRQNKLRLWAITLFISGFLTFIQFALANFSAATFPQHAALRSSFSAFVFPNPLHAMARPTLVVEPGSSEKITARIYDPSGTLVFQTRVDDHSLTSSSDMLSYEVPIEAHFTPGVYTGMVLGYQGDSVSDRSIVRFSVVK